MLLTQCSLCRRQARNARHHGWYGSEGQLPRGVQKNGFYCEMASLCLGVQRLDFSAHAMRLPTVLWLFPQPLVSGRHFVRCLTPESRITDFSGRWHPGLFPYSALLGLTVVRRQLRDHGGSTGAVLGCLLGSRRAVNCGPVGVSTGLQLVDKVLGPRSMSRGGNFLRPCTWVQGREPCPQGHGSHN